MNHQYDFQEQLISERVPIIQIPNFQPLISSRQHLGQLNNETLKNIQLYLQQSKNRQFQRIKQIKARQQFIGDQVLKQQIKKQQKIKNIEATQKQKLLKQCTFKPSVITKGSRRGLNQFLENQNDHLKKVEAKKRNLRMTIENQKQKQSYKPKINQNASRSRKSTTPIYERLYALKDKQNMNINMMQINVQNTFTPCISSKSKNLSRPSGISDLLYGDALRRQQKSKDILLTQTSQPIMQSKPLNLNNQKYAAQRFIREYFGVLQALGINLGVAGQIDYIMWNQVLREMGFIKREELDDGVSVYERSLVHQAYTLLENYGVNARNTCVFLLGLIGIYHINPINFQEGQESAPQKEFNLDQNQGRKMQKHFDTLFRNRLNCQNFKKNSEKGEVLPTFQPKINKKSQGLAQKYRTQMLEEANQLLENYPQLEYSVPQDGIISHTQLLVLHNMAKQVQRKKKKQQNQNQDMSECTFKPTTLSSMQQTLQNSKVSNFDSKLGQKKSFELYNYYKSLQSKKQSLKVSRQVQDRQCTFTPNLHKQKVSSGTLYAKQIDQTLYRLHKGRCQKQQKQKFLQRGQKHEQKTHQNSRGTSRLISQPHQDQDKVATLILDVNLGDRMDRISLFKGDEERLEQIAEQFALKHQLDQESQEKLLELLRVQLYNVLEKIQEDQQGDDADNQN